MAVAPRKSTQSTSGKKRSRGSSARNEATSDQEEEEDEEEEEDSDEEQVGGKKGKGKNKSKPKEKKDKGKGKKKALEVNSDEEEGSAAEDDDEEGEDGGKKGALTNEERTNLVQEFTRYILFCEYSRKPIRRDEIVKLYLTKDKRAKYFPDLMLRAQVQLRNIFGMELVLLRVKEGVKSGGKIFALRSTLPLELINASLINSYETLQDVVPSTTGLRDSWKEVAQFVDESDGFMRDSKKEGGNIYGLLGVILGLILVNGKTLSDEQLVSYLRRLGLSLDSHLPTNIASTHPITLSTYLTTLIRQNYLEKNKSAKVPGAPPAGGKKGSNGGEVGVKWKWGARSEVEIGETGIAGFLQAIYDGDKKANEGNNDDDDEEEEIVDEATKRKQMKEKTKKFRGELCRAAGTTDLVGTEEVKALEAAVNGE